MAMDFITLSLATVWPPNVGSTTTVPTSSVILSYRLPWIGCSRWWTGPDAPSSRFHSEWHFPESIEFDDPADDEFSIELGEFERLD